MSMHTCICKYYWNDIKEEDINGLNNAVHLKLHGDIDYLNILFCPNLSFRDRKLFPIIDYIITGQLKHFYSLPSDYLDIWIPFWLLDLYIVLTQNLYIVLTQKYVYYIEYLNIIYCLEHFNIVLSY